MSITGLYLVNRDPQADLLSALRMSPFEFALTGSRYFFPADVARRVDNGESVDYDFYVNNDPQVFEFLHLLGFRMHGDDLTDSYEGDPNIALVLRHKHGNIDVQLVSDIHAKEFVQRMLSELGVLDPDTPREAVKEFWRRGFELYMYWDTRGAILRGRV